MNNIPREKLIQILKEYGHSLVTDPQRCKAFLLDYCGEYRSEINILMNALQEGVATELRTFSQGIPTESIMAKLRKKLEVNLAMREDAAQWAVESWALALGVISEADLRNNQGRSLCDQHSVPPIVQPEYKQESINSQEKFNPTHESIPNHNYSPSVPSQDQKEARPTQPNQYSVRDQFGSSVSEDQDLSLLLNNFDNAVETIELEAVKKVNDLEALKKAKQKIKICYVMAIVSGIFTTIFAFSYGGFYFIDVILTFGLSFGVYKKNRSSALALLIYFVIGKIIMLLNGFSFSFLSLIWILAYWQGVQGTFTYHKLKKAQIQGQ